MFCHGLRAKQSLSLVEKASKLIVRNEDSSSRLHVPFQGIKRLVNKTSTDASRDKS